MIHFEFTLTDYDAEFLFDVLQAEIVSLHMKILECTSQNGVMTQNGAGPDDQNIKNNERLISYYESRIVQIEQLKGLMKNTRV